MKIPITLLLLLVLAACTTQLYVPSDSNVNKRQPASLSELQQGHELFVSNCGKCHKLKKPDGYTPEKWTGIMEKMGPKAKLTKEQSALVYKYVVNY